MSAVMRCKFQLHGVEHVGNSAGYPGIKVKFGAVYAENEATREDPNHEDGIFGKYTPHGSFEATIYNPNLVATLPTLLGKKFYLDFSTAE